jgi:hypothetical protein
MNNNEEITNDSSPMKYFGAIPHMAGAKLDLYEHRLYCHYVEVCGLSKENKCTQAERTIYTAIGMSKQRFLKARKGLVKKGFITFRPGKPNKRGQKGHAAKTTIIDIWAENIEFCKQRFYTGQILPVYIGVNNDPLKGSDMTRIKNKKNVKEEKDLPQPVSKSETFDGAGHADSDKQPQLGICSDCGQTCGDNSILCEGCGNKLLYISSKYGSDKQPTAKDIIDMAGTTLVPATLQGVLCIGCNITGDISGWLLDNGGVVCTVCYNTALATLHPEGDTTPAIGTTCPRCDKPITHGDEYLHVPVDGVVHVDCIAYLEHDGITVTWREPGGHGSTYDDYIATEERNLLQPVSNSNSLPCGDCAMYIDSECAHNEQVNISGHCHGCKERSVVEQSIFNDVGYWRCPACDGCVAHALPRKSTNVPLGICKCGKRAEGNDIICADCDKAKVADLEAPTNVQVAEEVFKPAAQGDADWAKTPVEKPKTKKRKAKPRKAKPVSLHKQLFGAISEALPGNPDERTKPDKKLIGLVASELKAVKAKPEEMPMLYYYCKKRFDNPTARAMSKHYAAFKDSEEYKMIQWEQPDTPDEPPATDEPVTPVTDEDKAEAARLMKELMER